MDKSIITEQEFEEMVERMRPRLMKMGREFFGSDTEAEEIIQETWLRAWNVREKVTLTDAYVLRIARNCCVSMWRGERRQVELNEKGDLSVTEATPQEELEEQENSEWLQSRLQRLPKGEREVWDLFYNQGLTVEEISNERGTTVATVRKTISNVRNTLRKDLRRHFLTMRHLIIFIIISFATGIAVAAIMNPNSRLRGVFERMFSLPEDTTVHNVVEFLPSYPGDLAECFGFVDKQMQYPQIALDKGIEGRVYVRFVVEKDGALTHFEVLQSPDTLLSTEALRIMKKMPRWTPARDKGKIVRSRYGMPIIFKLKKNNK